MSMSTIYRDMTHTDHEHEARTHAFSAGWSDASFEDAYGDTSRAEMPERFEDVREVWSAAYEEGREDYDATEEDEAIYGHDWRGGSDDDATEED
jgi:hypothetical protein